MGSYNNLLDRYRLKSISELLGNTKSKEEVIANLKSSTHNKWLIDGVSGCGKTALARLIAKEVDCVSVFDVTLSDTYSTKYKDETLQEAVNNTSSDGRRVYLIDDCSIFSRRALDWVADLLANISESDVAILCTTDISSIPEALVGSCGIRISLSEPDSEELLNFLVGVCTDLSVEYDIEGLKFIVKECRLNIRHSLFLLEHVLTNKNEATYSSVKEMI